MKIYKSKRGQIATIIAPFLTLVVAIISLYTMASFSNELKSNSNAISENSKNVEFNNQYVIAELNLAIKESLKQCPQCSQDKLKENIIQNINLRSSYFKNSGAGNFYSLIKAGNFQFTQTPSSFKFEIKDLFVSSEIENYKVVRNFDLCLEYNDKGNYKKAC